MGFIGRNSVYSVEYTKSRMDRPFLKILVNSNTQNTVLVIMKNPSTTCNNCPNGTQIITTYSSKANCHIDKTTGRVLRKLTPIYDEIIVLNLYSLYASNPTSVNSYYYGNGAIPAIMGNNNNFIQNYLQSYKGDIICAWGKSNGISQPQYDNQITLINSFFNSQHVLKEYDPTTRGFINRTTNKYPPHGLTWK